MTSGCSAGQHAHAGANSTGVLTRLVVHGSSMSRSRRLRVYLGLALLVLVLIWVPVGGFVLFAPTQYVSTWALILPGSGAGHAVSLDSVGQASATVSSPYNSRAVDPKVNYKALARSAPVLAAAAQSLGLSAEAFGRPRIKLVDQTAMLQFRLAGASAAEAQAKSRALYTALQDELERLRSDELARREAGTDDMLAGFGDKLREAQQRILDYQGRARIVSIEQFNELTLSLERMRASVRALEAERAGIDGQVQALRGALGTDPQTAAALLELQHDALFQQLVERWAGAEAVLTSNRARWGDKHTQVVNARADARALRGAVVRRAKTLLRHSKMDVEHMIARGTADSGLYQRLLELLSKLRGTDAQITSLKRSITEQQVLLERSTTDASNLEDLKRRHQVATAVFTTALAKADIGKSDRFSSYPLVQLLAAPTLPDAPDTLARNLALLGGGAGSALGLFGLLILWLRKPLFRAISKSA